MSTVDRSTVVMSIRPVYADRILDGTKTLEFRRKPLPDHVKRVLIWRTGTGGGIVGQFDIGGQEVYPAENYAYLITSQAGILAQDLLDYAGGDQAPIAAIGICGVVRFPRLLPGADLGIDRAPQSWRYAPTGWRQVLGAVTGRAPQRVQRRRTRGYRMPEDTVYVGRGTRWGNPYRVTDHPTAPGRAGVNAASTAAEAVALYRAQQVPRLGADLIRRELAGRDLACWCALDGGPCHADVLLTIANSPADPPPAAAPDGVTGSSAGGVR